MMEKIKDALKTGRREDLIIKLTSTFPVDVINSSTGRAALVYDMTITKYLTGSGTPYYNPFYMGGPHVSTWVDKPPHITGEALATVREISRTVNRGLPCDHKYDHFYVSSNSKFCPLCGNYANGVCGEDYDDPWIEGIIEFKGEKFRISLEQDGSGESSNSPVFPVIQFLNEWGNWERYNLYRPFSDRERPNGCPDSVWAKYIKLCPAKISFHNGVYTLWGGYLPEELIAHRGGKNEREGKSFPSEDEAKKALSI